MPRYSETVASQRPSSYQRAGGYQKHGTDRQQFHHSHTSLGAAGHWIHLLSVAAPLVIGEVVKDADKRWRALRGVSVGAALLSEAAWTYRLAQERKKDEAAHEALKECSDHCR